MDDDNRHDIEKPEQPARLLITVTDPPVVRILANDYVAARDLRPLAESIAKLVRRDLARRGGDAQEVSA